MHKALFMVAAIAGIASPVFTETAAADPYKWCAVYSGRGGGGGTNCGFVTLAQCRATVSGVGGVCAFNQFYTGDEPPLRRARKRHRG